MLVSVLRLIWAILRFIVVIFVVLWTIITGFGDNAKRELIDSFIKDCLFKLLD